MNGKAGRPKNRPSLTLSDVQPDRSGQVETLMRKLLILAAAAAALTTSACNTVAGAGKDVESVGGAVKDTA